MRIVLDTGILVSALISQNTPPAMLYQAWINGHFELITSTTQLEELKRVLHYPKLQRLIKSEEAKILLATIHAVAECIDDIPDIGISPDPDDNKIIATAIAGKASILVSGDKADILSLSTYDGVEFITAREATKRLRLST